MSARESAIVGVALFMTLVSLAEVRADGYRRLVIPTMDTTALDAIGTRLHIEVLGDVTENVLKSRKFDSVHTHFMIRQWKDAPARVRDYALPLPVRDTSVGATVELNVGLLSSDTLETKKSESKVKLNFAIRLIDHVTRVELLSDTTSVTYDEAADHKIRGDAIMARAILGNGLGGMIANEMMQEGTVRDIRNKFRSAIVQFVTVRFPKEFRGDGNKRL